MSVGAVRKGPRVAPDRLLVYGVEGIGKSSFAAEAPGVVFLAAEDGIRHLDVASFPEPTSWAEVLEAVAALEREDHAFRTLAVDTVDWIEPLIHEHVCRQNGWANIESPGYGKGYVPAANEWRRLLVDLDRLRATRGMEVILLAHAAIKAFSNPAGPDFSRYELKLQRSAAALVKEWTDANLFAIHEEIVAEAKGMTRAKGIATGRRILRTERTSAFDAKNRHNLPPVLPLSYEAYVEARDAGRPAESSVLYAEALELLDRVDAGTAAKARKHIEVVKADSAALAKALNRLRVVAAEGSGAPAGGAAPAGTGPAAAEDGGRANRPALSADVPPAGAA